VAHNLGPSEPGAFLPWKSADRFRFRGFDIIDRSFEFALWQRIGLPKPDLFETLSAMKTVTLRSLRRDTGRLDSAVGGEDILVTRFGKPCVRIISAIRDAARCEAEYYPSMPSRTKA